MNRIVILGNSGTGKSTLARELSGLLNIPVYHTDKIYHTTQWPDNESEKIKIWEDKLKKPLSESSWIFDGGNRRMLDLKLSRADTVIFLDYNRLISFQHLLKRRFMYRNTKRPDMPDDWQEKIDLKFWKLVWNFNKKYRPGIIEAIDRHRGELDVYVFKSQRQTKAFVNSYKNSS